MLITFKEIFSPLFDFTQSESVSCDLQKLKTAPSTNAMCRNGTLYNRAVKYKPDEQKLKPE